MTAPQQCGAVTAFTPFPCRVNGVGYNTTENTAGEDSFMFGAPFQCVGESEKIMLQELSCSQGFEDGEQIQVPFDDPETGLLNAKVYEFWDGDGWVDIDSSEVVGDTVGLEVAQGAWFLAKDKGKTITIAGQVKKGKPHSHIYRGLFCCCQRIPDSVHA